MSQCPNCNNQITEQFCSTCGEKKYSKKSFKTFMGDLFESVTDLDGRFYSSIKALLFSPGQLTLDYLAGKHKYRINPVQLFLLVNLVYFLFIAVSKFNTFTTPLSVHMGATNFWHQDFAKELVETKLATSGELLKDYAQRFDQRVSVQSKTLIFLMIPGLWLASAILFLRQKNTAFLSLVFSTHYLSFFLLGKALFLTALYGLVYSLEMMGWRGAGILLADKVMSPTIFIILITYGYCAFKRVSNESTLLALGKAIVYAIASYQVVLLYRMILFFTSFYSLP